MRFDAAVYKTILIIGAVTLAADAIWLTLRYDYHNALFAAVQKSPLVMRLLPAIGVYILLPVIIYLAAVRGAPDLQAAVTRGAVTGALLYGFYDLTNYATLRGWTLEMTLTDTAWGAILALVAYDDSAKYLSLDFAELKCIVDSTRHPAAVLLLPAVKARELINNKAKKAPLDGKTVEIDGIKYRLTPV